jgi:hypothetical protein
METNPSRLYSSKTFANRNAPSLNTLPKGCVSIQLAIKGCGIKRKVRLQRITASSCSQSALSVGRIYLARAASKTFRLFWMPLINPHTRSRRENELSKSDRYWISLRTDCENKNLVYSCWIGSVAKRLYMSLVVRPNLQTFRCCLSEAKHIYWQGENLRCGRQTE